MFTRDRIIAAEDEKGNMGDSGAVEKAIENGLVRESLYEMKLSSMFACVFKHAQSKFVRATRKFVTFSKAPQSPIHGVVFPGWRKAGTGIAGALAASPRFSLWDI
jgi:hypothetical protein